MITKGQLKSLNVGDVIEAGVLIPGLVDEKVLWSCINITGKDAELVVSFEVTYFGIWLARYEAFFNKKSGVSFREAIE